MKRWIVRLLPALFLGLLVTQGTAQYGRHTNTHWVLDQISDSLAALEYARGPAHFLVYVDTVGTPDTIRVWDYYKYEQQAEGLMANATSLIQGAVSDLTAGRSAIEVVEVRGVYTGLTQILIPSYTLLNLENASLKAVSAFTGEYLLKNSDQAAGNTQVHVRGGFVDANRNETTAGTGAIGFVNCTYSSIRGVYAKGGNRTVGETGYGISFDSCTSSMIVDCWADSNDYDGFGIIASTSILLAGVTATNGADGTGIELATNVTSSTVSGFVVKNYYHGIEASHFARNNTFSGGSILNTTDQAITCCEGACDNTFGDISVFGADRGIALVFSGTGAGNNHNLFSNIQIDSVRTGVQIDSSRGSWNIFDGLSFSKCTDITKGLLAIGARDTANEFHNIHLYNFTATTLVKDAGVNTFGEIEESNGRLLWTANGTDTTRLVTHRSAMTPNWAEITPLSNAASASYYVDSFTPTTFRVVFPTAPVNLASVNFAWRTAYRLGMRVPDSLTVSAAGSWTDTRTKGPVDSTINYGGDVTYLYCGVGPNRTHLLLRPDISSIPATAIVQSCTLKVMPDLISGHVAYDSIRCCRVTQDYVEGTAVSAYQFGSASWVNRGHGTGVGGTTIAQVDSAWTLKGGTCDTLACEATVDFPSTADTLRFSIPYTVQHWISNPTQNYGVILRFWAGSGDWATSKYFRTICTENLGYANRYVLKVVYTY